MEIRVENKQLRVEAPGTGEIKLIGSDLEELIEEGFMDSETVPAAKLINMVDEISDQLGLTWKGATHWDPMGRNVGGAVFMSNIWRIVE